MIEQYLQIAIEFLKEIWFQLDSKFGLEETEAFQFIKPYLLQLQDNPTYMGIALAALVLIPLGLYKIRSNARDRDRKLEELMEEMDDEEEEYGEDDPRRLRRPEPDTTANDIITEDELEEDDEEYDLDEDDKGDKPLFEKEEEGQPAFMQILEKLDEEDKDDELHVDTQKVMGTEDKEFELEPISSELAEPDINKDLSEFEGFDFDSEDSVGEDSIGAETSHDQAIEELQKEGELIELDGALSADDPFSNYSDLDDEEQDRAIQELQDEMESTINKLTEQLESDTETPSSVKDLGDISIGDEATIDDEFSLDQELSMDGDISKDEGLALEEKSEEPQLSDDPIPEPAPEPEAAPEPEPEVLSIEQLGLTEEPVIDKIESEPLEPVPERNYSFDGKSGREAESLINRLKYFQENLDTRFHHADKGDSFSVPEASSQELPSEPRFVEQRSFASKSPRVSPEDNKKYMEVLESFIFLKDQNKH